MERYRFAPPVAAMLEMSPIPMAIYQFIDRRVVTLVLSEGFCELFGYEDRALACYEMDNDMYKDTHPDDKARIADAAVRFATQDEPYNVVYRTLDKKRKTYQMVHAQGRHFFTETGVRLAVVWYTNEGQYDEIGQHDGLSGVLNRLLLEDSRIRRNSYDVLTGIPNMTYFFELAEAGMKKMRQEGIKPVMLFIDLCGMKAFNRKYGFAEGDHLLREFTELLTSAFSMENCGRFGQDHFAVYTGPEEIEKRLNSLFEKTGRMNQGKTLPVRVGIYPVEGEIEPGQACDRAKMACDKHRKSVASVYDFFDPKLLENVENRRYITDNFDRAIREKWIQVYYQPIIRTANGCVCDEEALARWADPVKGILSPADFIPALEESRQIYKLDLLVCEQVLEKMKIQAEAGLYVVPTSVNLSRADFETCDIVEEIRRRVDDAGIPREKLTVEITESMVGSDFDFMKAQVERFRELGFQVWMDDFGSGYSSLDVLQNIRFDVIKIDMRFMKNLSSGEEGKVILTELVKMAIGLGIDTVCEGVEQEEQVKFLQEIGCTKMQGFYFCRPIPLDKILERYQNGTQIGFENPAESEYYAAIGRINLYDVAALAKEDDAFSRYFDTLPMAIAEVHDEDAVLTRCNKSYRDFMKKAFGDSGAIEGRRFGTRSRETANVFLNALIRCAREGIRSVVDESIGKGMTVHSFVRRVAVNPVTGTAAVAIAVLSILNEEESSGTTYARIARALSADYAYLYYVDLESEKFIEYSPDPRVEDLTVERHGENFFAASRQDAMERLPEEDRKHFTEAFTKENVVKALNDYGSFSLDYKLLNDDVPVRVSMKAMRMQEDLRHIIIGVRNTPA